ncbi:MAG: aspartate/glutamate racemase family protein [Chloroflexota bacterium]
MKIWYQTMTSYRYDPLWEDYGKIIEEQCKKVARPDTEIYVTGVPGIVPQIDQYKSLMLYNYSGQGLNHLVRAEKEGYDAVVIGCSYDVGMEEARELLNIPVLGVTQTTLHMASLLGELYAIVSCTPYLYERYRQMIIRYGLQQKFLAGHYIYDVPEPELAKAMKNPEPLAKKFFALAENAVADGASVIIPTPVLVSQTMLKSGWKNYIKGALVLDPVTVTVKMAEMMVELNRLGVGVSRKLNVSGHPSKQLMDEALKVFTPLFKIER